MGEIANVFATTEEQSVTTEKCKSQDKGWGVIKILTFIKDRPPLICIPFHVFANQSDIGTLERRAWKLCISD